MTEDAALPAVAENPFYVLEVAPTAARGEIEREGRKLLDQLDLGIAGAQSFPTPFGPRPRTAELVRWAMAELRDPEKRLAHELWAALPSAPLEEPDDPLPPPWKGAFEAAGLARRR